MRRRVGVLVGLAVVALVAAWVSCAERGRPSASMGPGGAGEDAVTVERPDEPGSEPVREHVAVEERADEESQVPPALRVRVTRPGGAPVPDVEIQIAREPPAWSDPPEVVKEGTTGADGSLSLRLDPGAYQVRGVHPDVMVLGEVVEHRTEGAVELRAGPGPRLVITAVDEDGRPVAGARVWERHSFAGHVVVTDAEGRADLGRVYPANPMVHVVAEGHVPWDSYVFGTWDGRDVIERRVTLAAGVDPVPVRVLEHDGSPAAGVTVAFSGGVTASGPDGRATLRVARFAANVWARAEAADGRTVRVTFPEPPPEGRVLEMRLPPPRPVRGRVVHAWTGDAVADAKVLLRRDAWNVVAQSAADGTFTLPHAEPDDLSLVAFAPGLAPSGDGWSGAAQVPAGVVVLSVAPTMALAGRAVDSVGEPVAGATVEAIVYGDAPPLGVEAPTATTAADGTFTVTGVPAVPRLITLVKGATGTGWSDIDLEIPIAPDGSFDVGDVVVPQGFDLDVPVTDDDGAPLPAAIVWVRWRIVSHGTPSEHRLVLDGRMDPVRGIPRDFAVAEINAPGVLDTVLRVDRTTTSLVADRPCIVRGRLVRADSGEPVPDVWVIAESTDRLYTLDGNNAGMKTLADGSFDLMRLRKGRYRLRARTEDHERFEIRPSSVDVNARTVDVGDVLVE